MKKHGVLFEEAETVFYKKSVRTITRNCHDDCRPDCSIIKGLEVEDANK